MLATATRLGAGSPYPPVCHFAVHRAGISVARLCLLEVLRACLASKLGLGGDLAGLGLNSTAT